MKQLPLYTAIASISLLSACSGGSGAGPIQGNQAPVVMVVDEITGTAGRSLVVDASSSYDPEGELVDVSYPKEFLIFFFPSSSTAGGLPRRRPPEERRRRANRKSEHYAGSSMSRSQLKTAPSG